MKANQYYAGACVVITGAGSGIGRLMALRIVEEGGRVAIWDINGEAAQTTADMANAQVGADPGDPKAIAFTVKSRRARSSRTSVTNRTSSGWRRSE